MTHELMPDRMTPQFVLGRPAAYALVGYAVLILFVGTTIPTPLYRVYQAELGFSSGVLTLLFSVYVFTLLPVLLVIGRVSDRIGRRPVLLAGLVLATLATALFAAGHGLVALFVARVLQGGATGLITSTATATLAELHPRGDRARAAYVASMANVLGGALGPLLAGMLAQYLPWPTTLSYLAYLLLLLPTIGLAAMPETVPARRKLAFEMPRLSLPPAIRHEFWLAASAAFIVWAATALFLTLAPSYMAMLLHLDNLAVGGGIVFLMLGGSALAQTLWRRLPPRLAMRAGLGVLIPGLAGIVLAVPLGSAALLFVATLIAGLGQGLAFMGSLAELNRIAPEQRRGDVTASYYVVTYVGVALPVIGVGFGAQAVGLFAAVAVFAALLGAGALALTMMIPSHTGRRHDRMA
ncbi:MAG TPA: MFS transporter [Acetobacteraceae bacterium]|nr:MFS transporter [Acetobacteraceae bacterium]